MPTIDVHQFLHRVLPLWPLAVVIAAAVAVRLVFWLRFELRVRRAGLARIDRMSGSDFERRLAVLFDRLGNRAQVIGSGAGDFGADLVLEKDGHRTVVQAKRWNGTVGAAAVREIAAARPYYRADAAMVVTTSRFSQEARLLARVNGVRLWDRDDLVAVLCGVESTPSSRRSNSAVPTLSWSSPAE
jgi:restriction system protein